jgi:vacuolar protein sorting-associated protein 53
MLLQQLSDACFVVDALEPSVREELVKNFCSKELTSYRQIFEGAGQNLAYATFISLFVIFL